MVMAMEHAVYAARFRGISRFVPSRPVTSFSTVYVSRFSKLAVCSEFARQSSVIADLSCLRAAWAKKAMSLCSRLKPSRTPWT